MSEEIRLYPEMNKEIVNILRAFPDDNPTGLYAAQYIEALQARVKDQEAEMKRLEKDLAWARRDEGLAAFGDYMNECCPVRVHQRENGETVPDDEIKCPHETCIYKYYLSMGFCPTENSNPRDKNCAAHTPICPNCGGAGYVERKVSSE